jgi:hypothetical protein
MLCLAQSKQTPAGKMSATTYQDKIVWHDPEQDLIFIKARGGVVTKVSSDPNNPLGNPHLFRTLADMLEKAKVPHPPVAKD